MTNARPSKKNSSLAPEIKPLAPITFLILSALCQGASLLASLPIGKAMGSLYAFLVLQGLVAGFCAKFLRLPLPWQIANFLIGPAAIADLYLEMSREVTGVLILVLVLIYLPTFWTRVPYFPTSQNSYQTVLELIPQPGPISFIDLGCGFGTMLDWLARKRPESVFYGVEIGPLPFIVSYLRSLSAGSRHLRISYKSFWKLNLADYDVVYAFLSPGPMPELWAKVQREMRAGSLFITNSFSASDQADKVIEIQDLRKSKLFVYQVKAHA